MMYSFTITALTILYLTSNNNADGLHVDSIWESEVVSQLPHHSMSYVMVADISFSKNLPLTNVQASEVFSGDDNAEL